MDSGVEAGFWQRPFGALIFPFLFILAQFSLTHTGHDPLGAPFVLLALIVMIDALVRSCTTHLPLAALSVGLGAQFYAPFAIWLPPLVLLVAFSGLRLGWRGWLKSAAAFCLPQIFTLITAESFSVSLANMRNDHMSVSRSLLTASGFFGATGTAWIEWAILLALALLFLRNLRREADPERRAYRRLLGVSLLVVLLTAGYFHADWRSNYNVVFCSVGPLLVLILLCDGLTWVRRYRHLTMMVVIGIALLLVAAFTAIYADDYEFKPPEQDMAINADTLAVTDLLQREGIFSLQDYLLRLHGWIYDDFSLPLYPLRPESTSREAVRPHKDEVLLRLPTASSDAARIIPPGRVQLLNKKVFASYTTRLEYERLLIEERLGRAELAGWGSCLRATIHRCATFAGR